MLCDEDSDGDDAEGLLLQGYGGISLSDLKFVNPGDWISDANLLGLPRDADGDDLAFAPFLQSGKWYQCRPHKIVSALPVKPRGYLSGDPTGSSEVRAVIDRVKYAGTLSQCCWYPRNLCEDLLQLWHSDDLFVFLGCPINPDYPYSAGWVAFLLCSDEGLIAEEPSRLR